jgi:hypothetical protein
VKHVVYFVFPLIKVKQSRYRPELAYRVDRGIALLFRDLGARRGWVVSTTPRPPLYPREKPGTHLQEAGWAPQPAWTCASPPGFDPRTVQSVVSCYTDWATRPTFPLITIINKPFGRDKWQARIWNDSPRSNRATGRRSEERFSTPERGKRFISSALQSGWYQGTPSLILSEDLSWEYGGRRVKLLTSF